MNLACWLFSQTGAQYSADQNRPTIHRAHIHAGYEFFSDFMALDHRLNFREYSKDHVAIAAINYVHPSGMQFQIDIRMVRLLLEIIIIN